MKKKLFGFAILLIVMLSSCKKANNDEQLTNNLNTLQIKSINVSDTSGYVLTMNTYYYDNLNRLAQITEVVNSPTPVTLFYKFEYYPLKVIVKRNILPDTWISEKTIYELNSVGLAITSTVMTFTDSNDSLIEMSDTYQYNSDGYLTTQVSSLFGPSPVVTASYQVANRNYESITWTSTASGSTEKENYSYDAGHINTIGNVNVRLSFLGKSSYNPMIKATMDSTQLVTAIYSYQYDSDNRIRQVIINGVAAGVNGIWYSIPVLMTHQIVSYAYY